MYLQKITINHLLGILALLLLVACSSSDKSEKKVSNTVLSISSPAYGSVTALDKINLVGSVIADQTVQNLSYTLNDGQAKDVTDKLQDGSFTIEVIGLQEGDNSIVLKATDGESNSSSTQIKVLRDSFKPIINITSHGSNDTVDMRQQTIEGQVQSNQDLDIKRFFVIVGETQQDIFQNLQEDNSFSIEFTLEQGLNEFSFTAVNEVDIQNTTTLSLDFPAGNVEAFFIPITTTPNSSLESLGIPAEASFVTGQAIVKFKEDSVESATSSLQTQGIYTENKLGLGVNLVSTSALSTQSFTIAQADSTEADSTLELIANLRERDDVLYAEPNYIYQLNLEPNDEHYKLQWHYPTINLPGAWDITTGNNKVVVAVLDSGITSNKDFNCNRTVKGYDFIDMDRDPSDDDLVQHGTHVAGTIGVCSNNTTGVTGVDWNAKLLHARVCGNQGCFLSSLILGLQWTTGLMNNIAGLPKNNNPADVVNMSLGGPGLSRAMQETVNFLVKQDKIVIVAAGNQSNKAELYDPAGLEGVITVGAINRNENIAAYSNHGYSLEIMAPGGQIFAESFEEKDGVLSTVKDGFAYSQGTSMAAPHIAGVISLMKAVNPDLNWAKATHYLQSTTNPINTSLCQKHGCGAGLVNAQAAVQAASTNQPIGPMLRLSSTGRLDLSNVSQIVTLSNDGDKAAQAQLKIDVPYVTVEPQKVNVPSGGNVDIRLFLKTDSLPDDGFHQTTLTLSSGEKNRQVAVFANLGTPTIGNNIPILDVGPLDWALGRINANNRIEATRGSLATGSGDEAISYDDGYAVIIEDVMEGNNYGLLAQTNKFDTAFLGSSSLEVRTGEITVLVILLDPDLLIP